jgi:surfeit locus 1 family protein
MDRRVRGLIVPAILALLGVAVLVALGNWQVRRLAWKEALIESATERPRGPVQDLPPAAAWTGFDIAAAQYRPFRLTGRFLHEKEVRVFTSLSDAKGEYEGPGYWIVTPFALEGGGTVLVNRGFAPQDRYAPADRGEAVSSEGTTVTGLLRPDEERNIFTPDDRPEDRLFFARQIDPIATATSLEGAVAPFTIDLLASETPPGGLPQAGETRMVFANSHLQYAITWYGLAAALAAVFASFAYGRWRGPRLTPPGRVP